VKLDIEISMLKQALDAPESGAIGVIIQPVLHLE
jgi:hypothetical protein